MSQHTQNSNIAFNGVVGIIFLLSTALFALCVYSADKVSRVDPNQPAAGERPPTVSKSTGHQSVIARERSDRGDLSSDKPFRQRLSQSYRNSGVLSLDDRLLCQEQIERVYHKKRIWPKDNPEPKPAFEKMVPRDSIEKKVNDTVKKCALLDEYWQRPITGDQLQAEMDRMVRQTKDPEGLKELFAALNNDPRLIAECLARPVLSDRLIRNWYARDDRFHGESKKRVQELQKTLSPETFENCTEGEYRKIKLAVGDNSRQKPEHDFSAMTLPKEEFVKEAAKFPRIPGEITFEETNDAFILRMATCNPLPAVPDRRGGPLRPPSVDEEWRREGEEPLPYDTSSNAVTLQPALSSRDPLAERGAVGFPPTSLRTGDSLEASILVIAKKAFEIWLAESIATPLAYSQSISAETTYRMPENKALAECTPDSWQLSDYVPSARVGHTAVWTGAEMIVWGGDYQSNTGGRYNPSTDNWMQTSIGTGVPCRRWGHSAVWTGSEMIIWGGEWWDKIAHSENSGGRYNPNNDSWIATSTNTTVPSGRAYHTAIWTGSEMIVWGGSIQSSWEGENSGGIYNPNDDSWKAISLDPNVPPGRLGHTAVWSGSEMIIWGGESHGNAFSDGGRYSPREGKWFPISKGDGAPTARSFHACVWTGSEMIVWGGTNYYKSKNCGGCYNPRNDKWRATSMAGPVPSPRYNATAVWTGEEMLIWGGEWDDANDNEQYLNTGGRYNPIKGKWKAISQDAGLPIPRAKHTAVWTGAEMIVWGGEWLYYDIDGSGYVINENSGGRYDPSTDIWVPTSAGTGVREERQDHTAVWTGNEMIIWGGFSGIFENTGGQYNPALDTWIPTAIDTGTPVGRDGHTAVWTGMEMIIWGGELDWLGTYDNNGWKYDPMKDNWTSVATTGNVPSKRIGHYAFWTGLEMIIWGGMKGNIYPIPPTYYNTGSRYNPISDSWLEMSSREGVPPTDRGFYDVVWTGSEMIVWGGESGDYSDVIYYDTCTSFDPINNAWTEEVSGNVGPMGRSNSTVIWTGSEMILWGGSSYARRWDNTGGRYNPLSDTWLQTSTGANCPFGRDSAYSIWTGLEMIIWGGYRSDNYSPVMTNAVFRYNPQLDAWTLTKDGTAGPNGRSGCTAIWTGTGMIIWGGGSESYMAHYFSNSPPLSTPHIYDHQPQMPTLYSRAEELRLGQCIAASNVDNVEDSFQHASGDLWRGENQWHIVFAENCSHQSDYYSPTHAWRFGDSPTCSYNGEPGTYSLTSKDPIPVIPDFRPPSEASPMLSFRYFLDTDPRMDLPQKGDSAKVEISTDEGSTWVTVAQDIGHWSKEDPPAKQAIPMEDSCTNWRGLEINLRDFIEIDTYTAILVRFSFTRDDIYNNHVGWIIDDIGVGTPAGDGSNPCLTPPDSQGNNPQGGIPYHDTWDRATFEWDVNGDKVADNPDKNTPLWTINEVDFPKYGLDKPGPHELTLKVTDTLGLSDEKSVTLMVEDGTPPTVSLTAPEAGASWDYSLDANNIKSHLVVWDAKDQWGIGRVRLSYATKENPAEGDWACIADSGEVGEGLLLGRDPSGESPRSGLRMTEGGESGEGLLLGRDPSGASPRSRLRMTENEKRDRHASLALARDDSYDGTLRSGLRMTEGGESGEGLLLGRDPSGESLRSGLRMTEKSETSPYSTRHSRARGNPELSSLDSGSPPEQVPGLAGMTEALAQGRRDPSEVSPRSVLRMTDGGCSNSTLSPDAVSFVWQMPTKSEAAAAGQSFPSASARLRVEVWDSYKNKESDTSGPFYIIQPTATAVRTLLLTNTDRLKDIHGADGAGRVYSALSELAKNEKVGGVVIDLKDQPGMEQLTGLYGSWDLDKTDPLKANAVADAIASHVKKLVDGTYTAARYIAIAGDDRIIPFRRVPDGTKTWPEEKYASQVDCFSTVGSAICRNYTLTDNYFGDMRAIHDKTGTPYGDMALPDLAVGRLVETPDEIVSTIDTFIAQDGQADLETALVTGYDFLIDGATSILGILGKMGEAPSARIGDGWGPRELEHDIFSEPHTFSSLNGHGDHFSLWTPGGGHLDSSAMNGHAGLPLGGETLASISCHGGLNVPDGWQSSVDDLDIPQVLLKKGASAYIGNTGFGWGLLYGVGYSERLMELVAENIVSRGDLSVGEALAEAKRAYFLQDHRYDVFDEKVLFEATLYGLPMYRVVASGAEGTHGDSRDPSTSSASKRTQDDDRGRELLCASGPDLQEGDGITQTKRSRTEGLPPGLTELSLYFDFGPGTYERQDTKHGRHYYTLNGMVNGEIGEPLQPLFIYDSRLMNVECHGALFTGGEFSVETGYMPVCGSPASSQGDPGQGPIAPGMGGLIGTISMTKPNLPTAMASDPGLTRMTAYTGYFRDGNESIFDQMNFVVYYSNKADKEPPQIEDPGAAGFHTAAGDSLRFSVGATDTGSGLYRVLVAYTDRWTAWKSHDLICNSPSGRWEGSIPLESEVAYFVQAVDNSGNTSVLTETGPNMDKNYQETGTYYISPKIYEVSPQGFKAAIAADTLSGKVPLTVTFSALTEGGTGPFSFDWDFGDGATAIGTTVVHSYNSQGNYTVALAAKDGASSVRRSFAGVSVLSRCEPACSATVPVEANVGQASNFTAEVTLSECTDKDPLITWSFGDGGIGDGATASHAYSFPGNYTWTLTVVADGIKCSKTGKVTVIAPCELTCEAAASPVSGTAPLTVAFTATASASNCTATPSYSWDFGEGSASAEQNPSHTYNTPGKFDWILTVTVDQQTCVKQGTIDITSDQAIPGDCDGDGSVSIGEVQKAVNMFLGTLSPACGVDANQDGAVSIGEIQKVINAFLGI